MFNFNKLNNVVTDDVAAILRFGCGRGCDSNWGLGWWAKQLW